MEIFKINYESYRRLRDDLVSYIVSNIYKIPPGKKLNSTRIDINFINIINHLIGGNVKNKIIRQLKNLWINHKYDDFCRLITAFSYSSREKIILFEYKEGVKALIYPNKNLDIIKRAIYTEQEIDLLGI